MILTFHGGLCCGIKTIHGFSNTTDWNCDALDEIGADNRDQAASQSHQNERFFHEAAPQETALERLDRYLEYCDRRRPQGVIEVVLAASDWAQLPAWEPVLLERGFKMVTSAKNSNSNNTIYIYHRVNDNGPA